MVGFKHWFCTHSEDLKLLVDINMEDTPKKYDFVCMFVVFVYAQKFCLLTEGAKKYENLL